MKRLIVCSLFIILSAGISLGQCVGNCTAVTAALTDSAAQQWPNATVTVNLIRPFGNPAPVLNNGVPVTSPVNTVFTNGSGVFTISLDDTTKLTPSGAQWQFTMCPNATVTNCSQVTTGVFGASQNLTTLLSNALIVPAVNAQPSLTRAYNNTETSGSQGALYWNTISNLLFGCNAVPCASNWVQIAGAAGSFSSPPPIGNVLPNTGAFSTIAGTSETLTVGITTPCILTNGNIDALCAGVGATGDVKIQGIIASSTYCPTATGCKIDLSNMSTTNDLLWLTNPVAGHNRGIQIILGNHTYVACQPVIDGQTGYVWTGPDAPANPGAVVSGGAVIKAGTAADGCPGNFPNGVNTIVTTFQHGPWPAGTYAALFNAAGNPDTGGGPIATNDSFGGFLQHITLNCNNLTTCSWDFFSSTQEERAGLFDLQMVGANNGCGFWDRLNQVGPPGPGGSGPVHFEVHYIDCVPGTQVVNCGVGSTTCNWNAFSYEGNTTYISFAGQSGCSALTNPFTSGVPQAYTIINGSGIPQAPVLTNEGNCTTPPTSCTLNTVSGGSGNNCSIVTTSGNQVTAIDFHLGAGTGYSNAQTPGGGARFTNITVTGQNPGTLIQVNDVFAMEGDYNLSISDVHTQNVHGAVIHHGLGNAPYYDSLFERINMTNGGDTGSTLLHCGVGSLSNLCTGASLLRFISGGNVVTDDPNNVILATGDTPSHSFIPFYPIPTPLYDSAGNKKIGVNLHTIVDSTILSGGAATITLTGASVFTNNTSYSCSCSVNGGTSTCGINTTSGSSFTVNGTGAATVIYSCTGK